MTVAYLPPVMSDVVVDLSHWQGPVDFAKVRESGIAAVILKTTQGVSFVDSAFTSHAQAATAAGLLVGGYHFFDTTDPTAQAAFFLSHVGNVPLLTLDFEPHPTNLKLAEAAAVFVTQVKAKVGRWPLLYTGRWLVKPAHATLAECPLWLAEYGSNPICPPGWAKWYLWQYTDGKSGAAPKPVPGIGPCDRSRFAGSLIELTAWWASSVPLETQDQAGGAPLAVPGRPESHGESPNGGEEGPRSGTQVGSVEA